jgi:photosystem II stability/assembly factor-like uncharacterized protein
MRLNMLLSVVLLMLLSGCAQVEMRTATMEAPTDGAVLIRVLPNMASASQFFKNWNSITVERLPTGTESAKQFALTPTLDATSRTAIYAGSLPPGTYRFVQFSAQQCGYMCVSSLITVNPNFSRFDVKSGRLTDLGELVQLGFGNKVLFAHGREPDTTISTEIIEQALPSLKPLLTAPALSWDADTVPVTMDKASEIAKKISYGFVAVKDTDQGDFVYGSANGVVFSWQPGQKPVAHDINSRVSVESVLVTPSGSWLAGGELGVLRQSDDSGVTWRSIRGNLPFGVVVDLNYWNKRVIATTLKGNDVNVYTAAEGSDAWSPLAHYQMDISLFWDIPGVRAQSYLVKDTLITTLPGRKVAVMDLHSGQSNIRELPGAIQMFSVSQDQVLRCRCAASIAVNPYESHDMGKTWQDSTNSRFMLMPTFRDDKNGVAFKGGFFAPSRMTYTADGGSTWFETTEAPIFFNQLFYSRDGKTAYAGSAEGAFWTSTDDGRHWQPVARNTTEPAK